MNIKFDTVYNEDINIYNVYSIREDFEDNLHIEGSNMALCIDQQKDCKIVLCYAKELEFKDSIINGDVEIIRGYVKGDDIK